VTPPGAGANGAPSTQVRPQCQTLMSYCESRVSYLVRQQSTWGKAEMDSTIIRLDRADLERRRAELLSRSGLSEGDLEAGAENYTLTSDEWDIIEELREIGFLLNDR
jgi:hypothetical protein